MTNEKEILVTGIVQGVGFRPFCARLAEKHNLGGKVKNTSDGVSIVLRGTIKDIDSYIVELETLKPDLAYIHSVKTISECFCSESGNFTIEPSVRMEKQRVLIPPDIATCDECMSEVLDPSDRRYRYPFTNCTNCGPRFSIIKSLPYDRPCTTMAEFPMCRDCNDEYRNHHDRRFHAQPNACPECGPSIWFCSDSTGKIDSRGEQALSMCKEALKAGQLVAIKGLGGYHLACDPFNDKAVGKLRERKGRPHKPFALMAPSLDAVKKIVSVSKEEEKTLLSARRPIVLCKKISSSLSREVAPGQHSIGVMLPYTPLHHMLLESFDALVMTSANITETPLVSQNEEALEALGNIADCYLMHDRKIYMKIDDSVLSITGSHTIIHRRARGYVPTPVMVSMDTPQILAAGSEMKSTFSLTQEGLIFPSQYLGDTKEMKTGLYYGQALEHFKSLYNLNPRYLVHDKHPMYLSTQAALKSIGKPERVMAVQHHHAHLAACLAEHDRNERVIGVIMDGTGYGEDGTIWGGEFLVGDWSSFTREGHIKAASLPGGDRSVLSPWRYGLSLLVQSLGKKAALKEAARIWPDLEMKAASVIQAMAFSPQTSSCGRLFDGIATLLGGTREITYDGQAAMELEGVAKSVSPEDPLFSIREEGKDLILDWEPFVRWVVSKRPGFEEGASVFHFDLARAICRMCEVIRKKTAINTAVLSGGVWQNRLLLEHTVKRLEGEGFEVLTHSLLSPNDESVSVGQAAIAGWTWKN